MNLLPLCSRIPGCGKPVWGLWRHRRCDCGPVCQRAEGTWWRLRSGPRGPKWHLSRGPGGERGQTRAGRRCPGRARWGRSRDPGGPRHRPPPPGPGRQAALPSLSRGCRNGDRSVSCPAPGDRSSAVSCAPGAAPWDVPPSRRRDPPWDGPRGQMLFSPAQAHVETLPGAQPQALMLLGCCQGHAWSPQPPRAGVPALLPVGSGQALAARSQQVQAGDRTG